MNEEDIEIFDLIGNFDTCSIERTPTSVIIDEQSVHSLSPRILSSLFIEIENHPDWIRSFEFKVKTGSGRADKTIFTFSNGIQPHSEDIDDVAESVEEISPGEFADSLSQDLEQEDYDRISRQLKGLAEQQENHYINFNIQKGAIIESAFDDEILSESNSRIFLWEKETVIKDWVQSENTENVINRVFDPSEPPIHLLINEPVVTESDYLGFIQITQVSQDDPDRIHSYHQAYSEALNAVEALRENLNSIPTSVPPNIFDSPGIREIYQREFVYAVYSFLAEQTRLDGNSLEVSIRTRRNIVESEHDLAARFGTEELDSLFDLMIEIISGDNQSSISYWQQAVAAFCGEFNEIAKNKRRIIHYHGFLQEEAAKEELEQIQKTVEEVFELTRTIGQAFSDASNALASELQKVTIAVLGAIVTNFVLVLRYSDFPVLFPFSVVTVFGILIFYFPLINNRISQTEEMMTERAAGFSMYLDELRSHVGERGIKLNEIRDQRDSYKRTAANTLKASRDFIQRVYLVLLGVLVIVNFYSLILTVELPPFFTNFFTTAGIPTTLRNQQATVQLTRTLAALPSFWLLYKLWQSVSDSEEDPNSKSLSINGESLDTGSSHYFDSHPLIIAILLILIVAFALFEFSLDIINWIF